MYIDQAEQSILLRILQNTIWAIRPEWIPSIHDIVLSHFFDKEHSAERIQKAEEKLGRKLDNSNNSDADIRKVKDTNILVIPIHGVIGKRMNMMTDISGGISTQKLQDEITNGIDNPNIDAIVLDIESPGGVMDFTKETADFIFHTRDKKLINSFANGEMASAAYYIGSSAFKIFSYPSALIGSIGVYMQNIDKSKFYEAQGTKVSFIRSKPLKAVPNKFEPLEEKGLAYIQGLVDSAYKMFISDVAKYRNKSTDIVENKWGTGQIFTAEEALRMGLIDKIVTSLDDALTLTARMVNKKKGGMNMQGMMEEEDSLEMEGFTHNSKTADTEPDWGSVDKESLPTLAFASVKERKD
jgi:signal peptide peptidase SppA